MKNLSSIHHKSFERLYELTNSYNKTVFLDKCIFWWQISTYTLNDDQIWFTRSIKEIADELNLSERSVSRYLNEFETLGLIERINKLCLKKRLYIRITNKLLNILNTSNSSTTKSHQTQKPQEGNIFESTSVFLNQNGKIENDNLAVSLYKDQNNNSIVNNTVSPTVIVDKLKTNQKNTNLYPTYAIEHVIGERLEETQKNYIKGMMHNLQHQHGLKFSSPEQLFSEITFSLLNKEQIPGIETFHHRVNIIAKLLRENRWLTPKGFYNHSDYGQSFRKKAVEEGNSKSNLSFKNEKKHENRQLVKNLKNQLSEITQLIQSESRYLDEATQNLVNHRIGSDLLIEGIKSKLISLTHQKINMENELIHLEDKDKAPVIEHNRLKVQKQMEMLQLKAEELRHSVEKSFDNFCQASTNQHSRQEMDSLFQHYEDLSHQLNEVEKQISSSECVLFYQKVA